MVRRFAASMGVITLAAAVIAGGVWAQAPKPEHVRLDPKVQDAMHLAMDADKILRNVTKDKDGRLERARGGLHDAIREMKAALDAAR